MKRIIIAAVALLLAAAAPSGTESKWTVTKGSTSVATATLLRSGNGARVEWRAGAKTAPVVFLSGQGKLWVRQSGGDIESGQYKGGIETVLVPALLKLRDDEKSALIEGYKLTRTSMTPSNADASNFAIHPRKSAASRIASLSGGLLGPSSSNVAPTAGGRGAGTKGLKLKDGGDYSAVTALENRDAAWHAKLDDALREFQKDGKVGKERNQ